MGSEWYLLRTKPSSEYLAAKSLSDGGFQIFFPRIRAYQPRFGHTDTPLFPGYLFVRCNPAEDGWPFFRQSHKIAGWISFDGQIPPVPEDIIRQLMEKLDEVNLDGGIWKRFKPGETVGIVTASFDGIGEVIETPKSSEAPVTVLLNFMGRLVSAKVPWGSLRELDKIPVETLKRPRRTRGKGRTIRRPAPSAAVSV